MGLRYVHTEDMEYLKDKNNIVSLKEHKNKRIYLFFYIDGYTMPHLTIDLEISKYGLLYPLSDIKKRIFSHNILSGNGKYTYLFVNIEDYPNIFYFNKNHDMQITY